MYQEGHVVRVRWRVPVVIGDLSVLDVIVPSITAQHVGRSSWDIVGTPTVRAEPVSSHILHNVPLSIGE